MVTEMTGTRTKISRANRARFSHTRTFDFSTTNQRRMKRPGEEPSSSSSTMASTPGAGPASKKLKLEEDGAGPSETQNKAERKKAKKAKKAGSKAFVR